MQEWLWASAADLGRAIGDGEIEPAALTRVYLDAIEAHPLRDRIYARVTADRAMEEAWAAEKRAKDGRRLSSLDGVPVSWKDLFDTAGVATEAGTRLIEGRVPDADAKVLQYAAGQGLVCLGKTHMSEIAFSGLGINPVTQTPPNLHDPDGAPGGSSSGAAASVAFGLAAAAIGSDTGGSVRVPSAWNDLVGFKPGHGQLPTTGVVPLCETFDTVGPLVRSVADAAALYAALGGPGVDLKGVSLEGCRFLVIGTVLEEGLEDAPASAFASALDRLAQAGATVDRADWPALAEAYDMAGAIYSADAWSWWGPMVEAKGELMFDRIRERVSAGRDVGAAKYLAHWRRLRALRQDYAALSAGYDAVLCPTVPIMPPNVEMMLDDAQAYVTANLMALRNTRLANLMGLASMSLPTGIPATGLCLNVPTGQEARLLRIGAAAERALA